MYQIIWPRLGLFMAKNLKYIFFLKKETLISKSRDPSQKSNFDSAKLSLRPHLSKPNFQLNKNLKFKMQDQEKGLAPVTTVN
jgi:hypothetical protein